MKTNFFMLYTNCIPVKGHHTSIIMDLDCSTYIEIPNLLYEILALDLQTHTIKTIKKLYNNTLDNGIDDYFKYLVDREFGFFIDDPSPFRKVKNEFYSPYKVISSVIAFDNNSKFDLIKVINDLDNLSCQILQLRFYDVVDVDYLHQIMNAVKVSTIRIVELYIKYDKVLNTKILNTFLEKYPRAVAIIYNSTKDEIIDVSDTSDRKIFYTTQVINNKTKEVYSKRLFNISHEMYYESMNYNSGLFRKVCIDTNGDIKNYLSHKQVFGNVLKDDISKIVSTEKFKEKYVIKNDAIEKCKDCQFRYMCLSNSDITYKNNKAYKLDTCNFHPYTNLWN